MFVMIVGKYLLNHHMNISVCVVIVNLSLMRQNGLQVKALDPHFSSKVGRKYDYDGVIICQGIMSFYALDTDSMYFSIMPYLPTFTNQRSPSNLTKPDLVRLYN